MEDSRRAPFEFYLLVQDCKTGEEYVREIKDDELLDLEAQLIQWAKDEFNDELIIDLPIMPKLEGDFYGQIKTDWADKDSVVCWEGAGFYLKHNE